MDDSESTPRTDFLLGGWLVQPSRNRLSREGDTARLEPKLMDVLALLARRAGEVVSKDEIVDTVWGGSFITDSVITRAVAGLRRALGDDAHAPTYIETISKRGYRLLAPVTEPQAGAPPAAPAVPAPRPPDATARRVTPFVVGQWVRGEKFYGRAAPIAEVLDGNRDWLWLLGTRRLGKTSLLKELEHLTAETPERGYFPLYWDLQGAEDVRELHLDFHEALLDAEERLDRIGIGLADVEDDDLFASLGRLRRRLMAQDLRLLLLCDEVEELLHLDREDPSLLRKMRRAMQSREGIRSVMASSVRLWALAERDGDTSPFLHGFVPPLYIGTLADEEARQLIRQTQLLAEARPAFDDATVELIRQRCGNHPYLMQLLAKRCHETGDVTEASAEVAADPMVSFFFDVDYGLLNETERHVLRGMAHGSPADDESLETADGLHRLEHLGFVRRREDRTFEVASELFLGWLRESARA